MISVFPRGKPITKKSKNDVSICVKCDILNYNFLPYVHKAKSSDVAGICMSKQTVQLFPCESQGEQFVQ